MTVTVDPTEDKLGPALAAGEPAGGGGAATTNPADEIGSEIEDRVPEQFTDMVSQAGPYMGVLIGAGISAVVGLLLALVTSTVLKQIFRRRPQVRRAINRTRLPLFCVILFGGAALSVRFAVDPIYWWQAPLYVTFIIAFIVSVAWWALRVVKIVEAVILSRYTGEGEASLEDRRGRRVQTQVSLIGRVLAAIIITLAVAAVLLLNESVRGLGAGLLASAGVVSVVAGLAMQTTLSNVFAGIQLAFTDSLRVGDVIIIEGNYGNVEEITLSNVVVKSWDLRRFIYPSSYFVATPFENWTRVGSDLLGTVELDVDWRVPLDDLRGRLKRLLDSTDLWDGELGTIEVVHANGGFVQVWATVSARNAGDIWGLRCLVREDLVNYLRSEHPYAVMTQRMLLSNEEALSGHPAPTATGQVGVVGPQDAPAEPVGTYEEPEFASPEGLFTGSIAAEERNREFSGPGEDAYRERRERQQDD